MYTLIAAIVGVVLAIFVVGVNRLFWSVLKRRGSTRAWDMKLLTSAIIGLLVLLLAYMVKGANIEIALQDLGALIGSFVVVGGLGALLLPDNAASEAPAPADRENSCQDLDRE